MSAAAFDEELHRAAQLFNAGEYHAAHEVLDALWETCASEETDFLKGLIQACIAMHHFQSGNLEGARKLYSGHRQYLGRFLPAHRGVDVASLLASVQAALSAVVRGRPGERAVFDPARRPRWEFAP